MEKLRDKDNWLQWRFIIRTLLEEDDDIINVCEGSLIRPVEGSQNYDSELKKFLKADKAARKLIVTTVERKPLDLLLSCTTAREMWKKLNTVYDMKSDENLSIVQKQFFDFKWQIDESVAHNLSKIEHLSTKMKSLGSEVPESMLVTRILSTLPKNFNHFHSAWDSVEDRKKNLENLTARLMAEEIRIQGQENIEETTAAFVTKAKSGNNFLRQEQQYNSAQYKDVRRNQVPSCYNCGKQGHKRKDCSGCYTCGSKGHLSRNCFKKDGRSHVQNHGTSSWQQKTNSQGNGTRSWQQKPTEKLALVGSSNFKNNDFWVIDSGASDHMTNRREWFSDYQEFKTPTSIKIGNGDNIFAYGKGNIEIMTVVNGEGIEGTMYDVLFVPDLNQNLFSVKVVAKKGINFSIAENGKKCLFTRDNIVIATGSDSGNLYKIDMNVLEPKNCNLINKVDSKVISNELYTLQLWHERFCHQNKRHVKSFLRSLDINVLDNNDFCEGCAYGKQHRLTFHKRIERATRVREIIHADVCGPMEDESLARKRYFVIFKDDFSGFRQIYFIHQKSEVIEKLKTFCAEIENQFEENIKEFHSDGGKEFKNKYVESFLSSKGIRHTVNVPYTPEQNGVAERENRIIVEAARSMLYSKSDLPLFLWAEAMNTAVHVINRTGPTKQAGKTPYELWYGKSTSIENFKVFGTECFVHIPKEKRKKLDKKALKGLLVGYIENCKGYRVYVPGLRDVILSRDVLFKQEKLSPNLANVNFLKESSGNNDETVFTESNQNSFDSMESEKEIDKQLHEPLQSSSGNNQNIKQLRDRRTIRPTDFYGCPITFLAEALPQNYNEALNSDDKESWIEAMQDEINSLHENKTWVLVEKPKNQKVINNRWVYTRKINPDNSERFKARLVIKGCSQKEGIDYKETFSPVVRFDTVRFMLSIAARNRLSLGQFDIKTAFLYGSLKEDVYMKQPEGFDDGTTRVCKLFKSLYGLKQAPRCWTEHFTNFIQCFGFCRSTADPCFYVYKRADERMFLSIYVDDGLVAASHEHLIDKLLNELSKQFKITSTRNVTSFLGVEIYQLRDGSIFISQNKYIQSILERFNLSEANCVSTPIEISWYANDFEKEPSKAPYREAVGNLMFLQVVSRPDISFAVNIASRALEKPSNAHWMLVKRIFRYLKGTVDVGLLYCRDNSFEAYSDADYAGDRETRKSTSGILCKHASAAITWQSKRQQCVALSTTEAEFVSAASAAKEIIWLKRLFTECEIDIGNYTLFIDNMSAIKLIKNPEFHQRSKHIDVKYHFIRNLYEKGEIDVKYVRSEEQTADVFTKALTKPRFMYMKAKLGLRSKREISDLIV